MEIKKIIKKLKNPIIIGGICIIAKRVYDTEKENNCLKAENKLLKEENIETRRDNLKLSHRLGEYCIGKRRY